MNCHDGYHSCTFNQKQPNFQLYWLTNDQHNVDQLIKDYIDKHQQHSQRKD